ACQVHVLNGASVPRRNSLEEALARRNGSQWIEVDGMATFVAHSAEGLTLDIAWKGGTLQVTVIDKSSIELTNLVDQRLRIEGLYEGAANLDPKQITRLTVPSSAEI